MLKRPFIRVFLTLLLTAAWLLAYPFLYQRIPFLQEHFRSYQYFERFLEQQPPADTTLPAVSDSLILTDRILTDSITAIRQPSAELPLAIPDLEGGYSGVPSLAPFFKALAGGDTLVRIAYYGDSSIEGDLICMTLRDSLQQRFGGSGVGFVPLTSEIPGFRRSVRHAFSDNWYRNIIGQANTRKMPRGISGEYFLARSTVPAPDSLPGDSTEISPASTDSYWVSYRGSKWFAGTRSFNSARFFYGQPQPDSTTQTFGRLYVSLSEDEQAAYPLTANDPVNAIQLTTTPAQRLRLQLDVSANYPLFGVSLEDRSGVLVDNFPCRGNAGRGLKGIARSVLAGFQEHLDYDLIILQYGLNVINAHLTDYSWYEDQLVDVIHHFQEAMPGVPILLIGVSDKATRLNGTMQTDPGVPRVNNAQRAAAERTGTAFFSLYEAMGGPGSMVRWVEKERPRLANYDYTHFNFKGARKASDFILHFLLEGFEAQQLSQPFTETELE